MLPSKIRISSEVKIHLQSGCKTSTERLFIWPARFR